LILRTPDVEMKTFCRHIDRPPDFICFPWVTAPEENLIKHATIPVKSNNILPLACISLKTRSIWTEYFGFRPYAWNKSILDQKRKGVVLVVHATIRMDIYSKKAREALEILRPMAERNRVEPGCISCRVYRDVQEEHGIMIEELWSTQEELERHLSSSDYRSVLLVVEMAKVPPEIRFSAISNSSGVETIEKARGHAG